MREITIIRNDEIPGFEDDQVTVHVNIVQRKIRNGQTIVLLDEVPADVQMFVRGAQIWEGHVRPKKDGSVKVYAGITRKFAESKGWSPVQLGQSSDNSQPVLSQKARRIKEVMDSNNAWVEANKRTGLYCFIATLVPIMFLIIGGAGKSLPLIAVSAVALFACIGAGFYFRSAKPATCSQCNAPTLTLIKFDKQFMGARSEQRRIHNHVTNEAEQRTVTVSDMHAIETWRCVTCNYTWNHEYDYVLE